MGRGTAGDCLERGSESAHTFSFPIFQVYDPNPSCHTFPTLFSLYAYCGSQDGAHPMFWTAQACLPSLPPKPPPTYARFAGLLHYPAYTKLLSSHRNVGLVLS